MSQLKISDFSGEMFKGFEVLDFPMSATTTSGEFYKLHYDTVTVKSASTNFFFVPITQKCQILSCGTLVANERYGIVHCNVGSNNVLIIVNNKCIFT